MTLSEWIKQFSATLSAGAIVLGLVAAFFAIWLPREFDDLRDGLDEVKATSTAAKTAAEASQASSAETERLMSGLTLAFARSQAESVAEDWVVLENFRNAFPSDLLAALDKVSITTNFNHFMTIEDEYFFIPESDFNKLTSEQQNAIHSVMQRKGWLLHIEGLN